jgi:hypothetical protein
MSGFGSSVPLGMNTPVGESEWNTFLRRRAELLDAGMQRLGLSGQVAQVSGAPPLAAFQATSLIILPQEDARQQMLQMPVTEDEYRNLLGAADFYEIDNAGTLSPDDLRKVIEERRQYLISRRLEEDPSIAGELYDTISTFLGTTGLNMVDAVVGASQRIPFLGDGIRKSEAVQNYRRGLAMLEEGFTGDMVDNERAAYERFARPLQHFLGYSAMVGTAAEAVGATGFAGGVASPLIRGSLQGGATGWLLEGGGDDPISHRAMKIALFAGTQGAAEWGLPKIAARLRRAFPRPSDTAFEPQPIRVGTQPPTIDAEYAFIDEPLQIGSGGAPQIEGSVSIPFGGPVPRAGAPPRASVADEMFPGVWSEAPEVAARRAAAMWEGRTAWPGGMGGQRLLPPGRPALSVQEASIDAVAASKQGTILESPVLPGFARQPEIQDADVAVAALASNPGQVSIIQGVGDTAKTIRRFLQDLMPNGVGPQDFRAVERRIPLAIRQGSLAQGGAHFSLPGSSTYYDPQYALTTGTSGFYDLSGARVLNLGEPANAMVVLQEARAVHAGDPAYLARLAEVEESAQYGLSYIEVEELGLAEIAKARGYQGVKFFENDDWANPSTVNLWDYSGLREIPKSSITPEGEFVRTDILVADGRTITNKMVKEYQEYGMFRGQQATTSGGQQVIIEEIGREFSKVRTFGSNVESVVQTADLLPSKASAIADDLPEAYTQMRAYAQSRMADEAARSGLNPLKMADWFSEELATQLPRYIDEFLDLQDIQGAGARGVYTASFTQARMADFKTLAPEEFAFADQIAAEVNQAHAVQVARTSRPIYIEEIAESKGMAWVPSPRGVGGTLLDRATGEEITMGSVEAGFRFLQDFNRTLPDYSPFTTAPVELAASVVGSANPGSSLGPRHYNDVSELVDDAMRNMDRLERMFTGGGGSGGPPSLPPGSGGFAGGGGFLPPGSLPEETLGAQFERLRNTQPRTYDEVMNRFDSLALRVLEPMRNFALTVEQNLHSVGVTKGTYWQHYSDVVNGRAVAHNEAVPWHREINDALGLIRRRFIRDGTVTLIGEMRPEIQAAAMENAGYTAREIQGQLRIRQILEGLREQYEVRQLMDYMPHLRSRAARGEDFGSELDAMFGGSGKFFAELVRSGSMDVREMNAGLLLHRWVRAATHHRHVQPAIDEMAQAWVHDKRVPDSFRELTNDWLELVAHGHTPGQDVVIPGVRHALNALKIPVTNSEVARGVNWIFTNMYRGALGMRPDVVIRDLLGPMFGGTRIGFAPIGKSYVQFFKGGPQREEMVQLALRGGWMERGMVPMGASEMFQSGLGMVPGAEAAPTTFAPWQEAVREGAARVGDAARDALPTSMRSGIQGTKADPLHWYTREGEFNRLITGHAGYMVMNEAIQTTLQRTGNSTFSQPDMAEVLMRSGAANYGPPIQRRIAGFVREGRYEEAAFTFANEVANSQFRYGTAEQSLVVRQSGVVGRFGSTFGTFTQQYVAQIKEGMIAGLAPEFGGSSVHRTRSAAAFLARHSAIAGALGLATAYTGWNFGKWFWHGSLGWGGGPMLISMMTKMQELTGKYNQAQGEPLSPMQTWAVQQSEYTNQPGFIERLNPYAGGMRTLEGLGQTFSSANPLEGTAEFVITGKRNAGDMVRQFNDAPYQIGPPQPWAPTPDWAQGQVPPQQTLWIGGGGAAQ